MYLFWAPYEHWIYDPSIIRCFVCELIGPDGLTVVKPVDFLTQQFVKDVPFQMLLELWV